jgi:hypothetical protein
MIVELAKCTLHTAQISQPQLSQNGNQVHNYYLQVIRTERLSSVNHQRLPAGDYIEPIGA